MFRYGILSFNFGTFARFKFDFNEILMKLLPNSENRFYAIIMLAN